MSALGIGVEIFTWQQNDQISQDISDMIESIVNGIQYGISFWDFIIICWPMLVGLCVLLYVGYLIANPKAGKCDTVVV